MMLNQLFNYFFHAVEKVGTCPVLSSDAVGICLEGCTDDYACDGAQKCCSNGCGHVCTSPEPELG